MAGGIWITGGESMTVNGTSMTGGVDCGTVRMVDEDVPDFRDCAEIRF